MYGKFPYIYHKNQPNVGKHTSPIDAMGYIILYIYIPCIRHNKNHHERPPVKKPKEWRSRGHSDQGGLVVGSEGIGLGRHRQRRRGHDREIRVLVAGLTKGNFNGFS